MFDKDISILRDVASSFVCSEADVHVARIWLVPYGSAKRAMEVKSCRHLGPSKIHSNSYSPTMRISQTLRSMHGSLEHDDYHLRVLIVEWNETNPNQRA
jgi:hypothetical protein